MLDLLTSAQIDEWVAFYTLEAEEEDGKAKPKKAQTPEDMLRVFKQMAVGDKTGTTDAYGNPLMRREV